VIHSFHLVDLPARLSARMLLRPPDRATVDGLQHAECLVLMQFGAPIVSLARLQLRRFAMFAQWDDAAALEGFLSSHAFGRQLATGWHVRLHYLRRYGAIAALGDLPERAGTWDLDEPIVAVTIARMRLLEVPRFLRWGRPVERLIASHPGAVFSTGAQRPPNTISTFSIWRTVRDMTDMVHGRSGVPDAHVHQVAMAEQRRRDFHHESTFMRFRPLSEHGEWQGRQLLSGRLGVGVAGHPL
jgi:hypothetical protein